MDLNVREATLNDIPLINAYWQQADESFLEGMGADKSKLPAPEDFALMLGQQIESSYADKKAYALIWEVDQVAIGHCNVNDIIFGQSAFMHLHLWQSDKRKKGMGAQLVRMSLPFFFDKLELETLYCQPKSDNEAPNRTLAKVGFHFLRNRWCTPGSINFEQEVNLWALPKETFEAM
ncbi:MAG: GNAT family protein [Bacteroidota bacterium]